MVLAVSMVRFCSSFFLRIFSINSPHNQSTVHEKIKVRKYGRLSSNLLKLWHDSLDLKHYAPSKQALKSCMKEHALSLDKTS